MIWKIYPNNKGLFVVEAVIFNNVHLIKYIGISNRVCLSSYNILNIEIKISVLRPKIKDRFYPQILFDQKLDQLP